MINIDFTSNLGHRMFLTFLNKDLGKPLESVFLVNFTDGQKWIMSLRMYKDLQYCRLFLINNLLSHKMAGGHELKGVEVVI